MTAPSKPGNNPQELPHRHQQAVLRVPTFRDANDERITRLRTLSKAEDPFLYFSDSQRRIDCITGKDKDNQGHQHPRATTATERKTRLSFEVHHTMILDDLYSQLVGVQGYYNGFDEGTDVPDLILQLSKARQ